MNTKTVNEYTDQEKIDFFNENWVYISSIVHTLQSSKKYIKAGTNMLAYLAEWLDKYYNDKQ